MKFTDAETAANWFASEGRHLTTVVRMAHANGHPRLAAYIAVQLWTDLRYRGALDDAATVQRIAVEAAQQAGLPEVEVVARNQLAGTLASKRDLVGAGAQLTAAMEICERTGDVDGESMARANLAMLSETLLQLLAPGTSANAAERLKKLLADG